MTLVVRGVGLDDCGGTFIPCPGGKVGENGDCKPGFEVMLLVLGGGGGMTLLG